MLCDYCHTLDPLCDPFSCVRYWIYAFTVSKTFDFPNEWNTVFVALQEWTGLLWLMVMSKRIYKTRMNYTILAYISDSIKFSYMGSAQIRPFSVWNNPKFLLMIENAGESNFVPYCFIPLIANWCRIKYSTVYCEIG